MLVLTLTYPEPVTSLKILPLNLSLALNFSPNLINPTPKPYPTPKLSQKIWPNPNPSLKILPLNLTLTLNVSPKP